MRIFPHGLQCMSYVSSHMEGTMKPIWVYNHMSFVSPTYDADVWIYVSCMKQNNQSIVVSSYTTKVIICCKCLVKIWLVREIRNQSIVNKHSQLKVFQNTRQLYIIFLDFTNLDTSFTEDHLYERQSYSESTDVKLVQCKRLFAWPLPSAIAFFPFLHQTRSHHCIRDKLTETSYFRSTSDCLRRIH